MIFDPTCELSTSQTLAIIGRKFWLFTWAMLENIIIFVCICVGVIDIMKWLVLDFVTLSNNVLFLYSSIIGNTENRREIFMKQSVDKYT